MPRVLVPAQSLALEMALYEETERRALEGDLTLLEAAWRNAEEIPRSPTRCPTTAGSAAFALSEGVRPPTARSV